MKCAPAFIYWHMNTNLHLVNRCKFAFFLLLLIGFYFYSFFLSILPSVRCATFGFSRIRFVFTNRGLCVFLAFPRFLSPSPPLSLLRSPSFLSPSHSLFLSLFLSITFIFPADIHDLRE